MAHFELDYVPRPAFMPFHNRRERWACLVAHRRAGKTVAAVNDMIRAACRQKDPYGYFAPYRAQAKNVVWEYFKFYGRPIIDKVNEAELKIGFINGSTVQLFGADNADAARGLGFRGVYCDEYGDFRPSVWGNVIRPTLSDRKGWGVFGGTPKGHNQFYDVYRNALVDKDWFCLTLTASLSKIIDPEELAAARAQLSPDQYDQEYECSFDAAILGAYYGEQFKRVDAEKRIGTVRHQPGIAVNTAWDLGYTDDSAIWWYQNCGNEIHILDHLAVSGATIQQLAQEIQKRHYLYGKHYLPHDARAKTLASGGKSIVEQLAAFLGMSSLAIVPDIGVEDGIQAARLVFDRCWFDNKCSEGIEALRQYQREYDEDKKAYRKIPLHNWASHPADAFRMLAVAERRHVILAKKADPVFKNVGDYTLDELWEEEQNRANVTKRI